MRKQTDDDRYVAPIEMAKLKFGELLKATLLKLFIMFVKEPMLLAVTIYTSFVYAVLYLLFEAVPLEFERPKSLGHGFNALIGGLVHPAFGSTIGVFVYAFIKNPRYVRLLEASPDGKAVAEQRLVIGMFRGATFFISFCYVPPLTSFTRLHQKKFN